MKPKRQNDFERDVKTYQPVIARMQSPLAAFEYLFKNASHITEYTLLFLVQERFSLTDVEVWKEYGDYQKKSGKPFGREAQR
jgi:hypothetical protein